MNYIAYEVRVHENGDRYWLLNGELHREDGPAVECSNGDRFWYLNGDELTEQEFLKRTAPDKVMTIEEIQEILGYKIKIAE